MQNPGLISRRYATLALAVMGFGLGAVCRLLSLDQPLKSHVPEFVALMLLAGVVYLVGVYIVQKCESGLAPLLVILGASVVLRLFLLPVSPTLSEDVYRYQWEGRVIRAGANPYAVYPALPELRWAQDPQHPVLTGRTTPTLYPPLSEAAYAVARTVAGYKRLFTAFDLATIALILVLLAVTRRPLGRVLIYAWNPVVFASFALGGHNDSLANLLLLAAILLIIGRRAAVSIGFLALAALSKLFPLLFLPAFLKRSRWSYALIFAGVGLSGYLPFLRGGGHLFRGLSDFAAGWEGNDSLFRLIRLAGNSKGQAELVSGVLLLIVICYVLKRRIELLKAALIILTSLLLLSSNAFPWYFTWIVPFLCFYPELPLLLLTITCALGYSPVVAYSAGLPYRDLPLMLGLEYLPVCLLLVWRAVQLQPRPTAVEVSPS